MDTNLSINAQSCIRCGKCVRVCPSGIFVFAEKPAAVAEEAASQSNAEATAQAEAAAQATPAAAAIPASPKTGKAIEIVNPETCIVCGHCVAVCPTGSVIHGDFPAEKVHPIDYAQLPTPEQVLLLCRTRRSNRAMSSAPVPAEMLDLILEAAHRAPTASNAQQVAFTLVTNPDKLKEVADFTVETFDAVLKKLKNPLLSPLLKRLLPGVYRYIPVFERIKRHHEAGNDPILRKSKALMVIHTPASNRFGAADANLAYQNGSLMAESLGVSQVYMGFVLSAIKQDKDKRLNRLLGIDGKIHAIMGLGMPSWRYPNYIDRKEIVVNKI